MKLLLEFARIHPWRSLTMLLCLIVAAAMEALALTSLLPLLSLVAESSGLGGAVSGEPRGIEARFLEFLAFLGLELTRGVLCLVIAGAFALRAALVLLARREIGYTVARVVRDLRLRLIRALLRTSWGYYVEQRVGTFANAYATEAQRASKAYLQATWVVMLGLQVAVYLGLALAISWRFTLSAVGLILFLLRVLRPFIRMGRKAGRKQTRLFHSLLGTLTDILQAVKPLKAMAREDLVAPLLDDGTLRMEKAMRKEVLSREAIVALQEPIIVCMLCAGIFLMSGVMNFKIALVGVLALLAERTFHALNQAQRRYQKVMVQESAYWSLVRTVENAERALERPAGGAPATLDCAIELRGVTVRYQDTPVFENLFLKIPAGEIVALTGPSGSGKTTIVDLIVGLVRPERGVVQIDGTSLADLDLAAWRRRVGYVPQELFLLHDSVAMNVALGAPEVSRADVERALKDAHAWDFVSRMPDGIDSIVGERGSALSGGQRQRIAIARAMLHEPWLLILDEATAALDPESETAVWQAVEELRGRTTVIAISHQPALLAVADRVYRVEGGRVSEVTQRSEQARSERRVSGPWPIG